MALKANKKGALSVKSAVIAALTLASLGSVLASSISINTSKNLEFGQGVFLIKACDSWELMAHQLVFLLLLA